MFLPPSSVAWKYGKKREKLGTVLASSCLPLLLLYTYLQSSSQPVSHAVFLPGSVWFGPWMHAYFARAAPAAAACLIEVSFFFFFFAVGVAVQSTEQKNIRGEKKREELPTSC